MRPNTTSFRRHLSPFVGSRFRHKYCRCTTSLRARPWSGRSSDRYGDFEERTSCFRLEKISLGTCHVRKTLGSYGCLLLEQDPLMVRTSLILYSVASVVCVLRVVLLSLLSSLILSLQISLTSRFSSLSTVSFLILSYVEFSLIKNFLVYFGDLTFVTQFWGHLYNLSFIVFKSSLLIPLTFCLDVFNQS